MTYPKERNTFTCFDDDPRNNGNGYNSPNPYDNYPEEKEIDEEETDWEEPGTEQDFQ